MADYKRIVSYMYNYEKGIKRNNIGYARIEGRNGQCKIVVNIKSLNVYQNNLKTYLFRRTENKVKYIYLGEIIFKNGIGELRVVTNMNNIMNTSYTFDDLGGVVVYSSKDKFFATEWDDKPIRIDSLVEMLREERKKEMEKILYENAENIKAAEESSSDNGSNSDNEPVNDVKENYGSHMMKEEPMPDMVENTNPCSKKDEQDPLNYKFVNYYRRINGDICSISDTTEDEPVELESSGWMNGYEGMEDAIVQKAEQMDIPTVPMPDDIQYQQETVMMSELAEQITTIAEEEEQRKAAQQRRIQELVAKREQERKQRERLERNRVRNRYNRRAMESFGAEQQRLEQIEAERARKEMEALEEREQYTAQETTGDFEIETAETDISMEGNSLEYSCDQEETAEESNDESMGGATAADRIFAKFPKMQPFTGSEITECVRIEPQDIGMLPMEQWILGNNSFLLHGYYSYRHLIFARMQKGDKFKHILGIPGINRQRELVLAKMFGFDKFQPVEQSDTNQEGFGYWYIDIDI